MGKQPHQKNLLINNSEEVIESFKLIGFEFYQSIDKIHLFSFKNFLLVVLKNIQEDYIKLYNGILTPTENYLIFYKKKGTTIHQTFTRENKKNINFSLNQEDYNLYFNLLHTFYINNQQHYSNYSASIYFSEIVLNYLPNKKLTDFEPD
jgi:hypothetical protein